MRKPASCIGRTVLAGRNERSASRSQCGRPRWGFRRAKIARARIFAFSSLRSQALSQKADRAAGTAIYSDDGTVLDAASERHLHEQ
jgi:hypothetical protein